MERKRLTLAGRMDDEDYQKTRECIEFLRSDRPAEFEFKVLELLPVEWEAHLARLREQDPHLIGSTAACVVYSEDLDSLYLGDDFVKHVCSFTGFKVFPFEPDSTDERSYKNQAKVQYKKFLKRTGHAFCFMEVSLAGESLPERLVFELFTDKCPHTCRNFLHLCVGDLEEAEPTPASNAGPVAAPRKLSYKGSRFFRIVKDGWIQGGDVVHNKGTGGHSIFGQTFPDECFTVKHDQEGILGMANNGNDTNASQFYITVKPNSWMDGRYVAFGRVIEGLSVVRSIHGLAVHPDQRPKVEVLVTDCGEVPLNQF
eukprot:RCo007025